MQNQNIRCGLYSPCGMWYAGEKEAAVMRHIFLTGDKQTGKSTILRALLAGRAHTGFCTEPFELHGRKAGYTLHSLTPLPPMENDCPCVIRVGEKLPSVREAAAELRVNPNTVQRAYTLLEEKGLIRSVPKKGAFVIFGEGEEKCARFETLTRELLRLKETGVSREEILSVIEEVYGND